MAEHLAKGFVEFVTAELMPDDLLGAPHIDAELIRLEEAGQLPTLREERRSSVDDLLRALLSCTPPRRADILRETPPTLAALALDRVQCGTHSILELARQGIQAPPAPGPLRDLYLTLLVQNF
jgi:hypothetical protein